jgi:hypothetical protein
MAMKQFLENPKTFGYTLDINDFYQTIPTKVVSVKTTVEDWTTWAAQYGLTYYQLKDFNIWLRDRKLTNSKSVEYMIQVPDKNDLKFNSSTVKIHNPQWVTVKNTFIPNLQINR